MMKQRSKADPRFYLFIDVRFNVNKNQPVAEQVFDLIPVVRVRGSRS